MKANGVKLEFSTATRWANLARACLSFRLMLFCMCYNILFFISVLNLFSFMPRKLRPFSGQAIDLRQKASQKLSMKLLELLFFFHKTILVLHLLSGFRILVSSIREKCLFNVEEASFLLRQMQEGIPVCNKAESVFKQ